MLLERLLRRRRKTRVHDMAAAEYVASREIPGALRACTVTPGGETLRILRLSDGWLYKPLCMPITHDGCTLRDLHQIYFAPHKYDVLYTEAFADQLGAASTSAIEDVLVLSAGEDSYWHFMMDFLPRLYFMAVMPEWRDYGVLVDAAATQREREVVAQVAARIGVPTPRFVTVDAGIQRMRNALCPGRIGRNSAAAIWDSTLYPADQRPNRGIDRLFVTRTAATRRLVNQGEIAARLQPLGFTCVEPGALSFDEQVATFAGARVIVGVHGAALANLLFAPRDAAVVELYTTIPQPFYSALAAAKGLRHVSISGVPIGEPRSHHDDFRIDAALLLDVLKELGVR